MQRAYFAAGCFWGIEATFRAVTGVSDTAVGYGGGQSANPTYRDICSGDTGHAEIVELVFDSEQLSFAELLRIFWSCHDPTSLNRQGPDVGSQYRSAIFFTSPEQEATIRESVVEAQPRFRSAIVTQVTAFETFYRAEEYHQRYLEKHGRVQCH
ncbi:MAG: peptide-methionine (S)-S-oxide reductase [Rhodothermales bacterium]|jgi:peptide-methionine (S)-S-oxide reductase